MESLADQVIQIIDDLIDDLAEYKMVQRSQFLNSQQAADFLGVTAHTMARNRVRGHGVPYYVTAGNHVMYSITDLEAFVARQRIDAPKVLLKRQMARRQRSEETKERYRQRMAIIGKGNKTKMLLERAARQNAKITTLESEKNHGVFLREISENLA